jgi:monoamine oxidase
MKRHRDDNPESAPGRGQFTRRGFLGRAFAAAGSLAVPGIVKSVAASHTAAGGASPLAGAMTTLLPGGDRTDEFAICHRIWRNELHVSASPGTDVYDCVILGGGMAGLVAAWKLKKLGITNVLLLDRNPAMGGVCRKDTINGKVASRASAYASLPFNADMEDMYIDLDIGTRGGNGGFIVNPAYVLKEPWDYTYIGGQWSEAFSAAGIGDLPVSSQIKGELTLLTEAFEDMWDFEDSRGRSAFDTPVENASPKYRSLDKMTFLKWANKIGVSAETLDLFLPALRSAYGLGYDQISAWAACDLLIDEWLPPDPGEQSIGFVGGNAVMAEMLEGQLPARCLINNALVARVEDVGSQVHVTYVKDGGAAAVRAKTAIFALPQFEAPYLIKNLPARKVKAVKACAYTTYAVANVEVSSTPPNRAYSNQLVGDYALSDFIIADWVSLPDPRNAPDSRPNVLTCYIPMSPADRYWMLNPELDEWQAGILSELETVCPGTAAKVTSFHLYRWGHAFALPYAGWVFSRKRKDAKRPFGRIFFGHADTEGIPTVDHAMASGFRTAAEVQVKLASGK